MTRQTDRQRTLLALLKLARIRRARLIERLRFETNELRSIKRALRATTRAVTLQADISKAG